MVVNFFFALVFAKVKNEFFFGRKTGMFFSFYRELMSKKTCAIVKKKFRGRISLSRKSP
jgi:hypothetical protein